MTNDWTVSSPRLLGEVHLAETDQAFLDGLGTWLVRALHGCTPGAVREAVIVLGELVTNAFRHAEAPYAVRAALPTLGNAVRLEVHDSTTSPSTGWALGKGLLIVRGLCPDWGVEHLPTGKTVWAELPLLVRPVVD